MKVIPAINETNFEEIQNKINLVKDFGAPQCGAHIDVADGKFTRNTLWNKPSDLITNYQLPITNPRIEVHLMVINPDEVLDDWLDAKVKRIIAHIEAIKNIDAMKMKCVAFGVELFLAAKPDTPAERLLGYSGDADGFLILAVNPGLPGQKFQEDQLDKIRILRQKLPNVIIMVDGGVNLETAPKIKEAGADVLVSASYIWESDNPKEAYNKLQAV